MERADPELGRVQRVDGPAAHVVALSVYRRDASADGARREVVVLDAKRGLRRMADRPRGDDADAFVRRLRKLLVGSRVHAEARQDGPGVRLVARRGDLDAVLRIEAGAAVLRDRESGRPLAARRRLATRPPEQAIWAPFLPPFAEAPDEAEVAIPSELGRALRRARKRLARKARAIEDDAARAAEAPSLRHEAELVTAHLGRYEKGAETLEVVDWALAPPGPRTLRIDAARGPRAHAEALFKRARRYERGAELAKARSAETRAALAEVDTLLVRLAATPSAVDLETLEREASAAGWWRAPGSTEARRRGANEARKPYRTFRAHDGGLVLVGRSAGDNDELTLRVARPHDLWLHARSVRGAHVVVPLGRREACPPERLIDAATLAAHFSEAAGESLVEVQHTPRRHVHKRRGLPQGAVHVNREKVLVLRYERERARDLVARELR